jgi:hypothetical protein
MKKEKLTPKKTLSYDPIKFSLKNTPLENKILGLVLGPKERNHREIQKDVLSFAGRKDLPELFKAFKNNVKFDPSILECDKEEIAETLKQFTLQPTDLESLRITVHKLYTKVLKNYKTQKPSWAFLDICTNKFDGNNKESRTNYKLFLTNLKDFFERAQGLFKQVNDIFQRNDEILSCLENTFISYANQYRTACKENLSISPELTFLRLRINNFANSCYNFFVNPLGTRTHDLELSTDDKELLEEYAGSTDLRLAALAKFFLACPLWLNSQNEIRGIILGACSKASQLSLLLPQNSLIADVLQPLDRIHTAIPKYLDALRGVSQQSRSRHKQTSDAFKSIKELLDSPLLEKIRENTKTNYHDKEKLSDGYNQYCKLTTSFLQAITMELGYITIEEKAEEKSPQKQTVNKSQETPNTQTLLHENQDTLSPTETHKPELQINNQPIQKTPTLKKTSLPKYWLEPQDPPYHAVDGRVMGWFRDGDTEFGRQGYEGDSKYRERVIKNHSFSTKIDAFITQIGLLATPPQTEVSEEGAKSYNCLVFTSDLLSEQNWDCGIASYGIDPTGHIFHRSLSHTALPELEKEFKTLISKSTPHIRNSKKQKTDIRKKQLQEISIPEQSPVKDFLDLSLDDEVEQHRLFIKITDKRSNRVFLFAKLPKDFIKKEQKKNRK